MVLASQRCPEATYPEGRLVLAVDGESESIEISAWKGVGLFLVKLLGLLSGSHSLRNAKFLVGEGCSVVTCQAGQLVPAAD